MQLLEDGLACREKRCGGSRRWTDPWALHECHRIGINGLFGKEKACWFWLI